MLYQGLIAAVLAICCLQTRADRQCTKMTAMTACFPNIRTYMERPVNLSVVMMAASGSRERSVQDRCTQFNQFIQCLDGKLSGCTDYTDARDPNIFYWENARLGVDYMCNDHREEFLEHQECLSTDATRRAALACDTDDDDRRRKRHTCEEYETEIRCADKAIAKSCGEEIARHVGQLARIFLKNTPHTKDCTEPEFSTASSAVNVFSTSFTLGVCLVVATRLIA